MYIKSGGEDTITLTNNTFYGNAGTDTNPDFGDQHCNAVVIYSLEEDTTPVNIYNNILWSNPATDSAQDLCAKNVNGDINLYNNDIHSYHLIATGGSINNGNNFSLDPLFINPAGGDFHLQADSPCRNTGLNGAPGTSFIDFEGQSRINEGTVDRGADEYQAVDVPTMTEWGMIIFMALAGLGSIYYLRRQKRV